MRQKNNRGLPDRSGFTLIEILIVVAIIAILASVVLVGLGPTQELGRDARRLSDLRETQTGLELYYSDCGYYPGSASCAGSGQVTTWAAMSTALTLSPIGIQQVPIDPTNGRSYYYTSFSGGSTYTIAATLEDANNSAFVGYVPPGNVPNGLTTCASPNYCLSL